jgi:hypothetical protein
VPYGQPPRPSSAGLTGGDVEAARTPLVLDVVLVVAGVAVAASPGAPATAAMAAPAPDTAAGASTAVLAAGVGRGPHKGEVDLDGLVEQLGLVCAVDGGAGLCEGGVLDQRVALLSQAKVVCHGSASAVCNRGRGPGLP